MKRFFAKVDPQPGGCHLWTGAKNSQGYGQFWAHGRRCRAHRVAWELANGEIPAGQHVLHSCDVPGCVNPDHLFLGTIQENTADKVAKGRQMKKLTVAQANAIRRLHRAGGISQAQLARDYGVTGPTINYHIRKKI